MRKRRDSRKSVKNNRARGKESLIRIRNLGRKDIK